MQTSFFYPHKCNRHKKRHVSIAVLEYIHNQKNTLSLGRHCFIQNVSGSKSSILNVTSVHFLKVLTSHSPFLFLKENFNCLHLSAHISLTSGRSVYCCTPPNSSRHFLFPHRTFPETKSKTDKSDSHKY